MNKDEKAGLWSERIREFRFSEQTDMQGLVHRASDTGLDNDILDPKTEKREKYICIRGG